MTPEAWAAVVENGLLDAYLNIRGVEDEAEAERMVRSDFRRLAKDGYLLVSEAELATALHETAIRNHNLGEGPLRAICDNVESHQPRAAAIFAALVAAQEKGEGVTPPPADALQGGGT